MPKLTFRHIFSILAIIGGAFLECFYYAWRFQNDGVTLWLSIIIGMSLTLLLGLSVFNRKRKWAWILMGALVVFSVMATSAGQSFSLSVKLEQAKQIEQLETYQTDEITDLINRRNAIDKELSDINNQINKTVTSLQDRANWKTALKAAEDRKNLLTKERQDIADRLKSLSDNSVVIPVSVDATINIYQFYNKLFGWKPESLQFILHTILSIFIAFMAPIGLITYPTKNYEKKERHIKRKKHNVKKILSLSDKWHPWVERWVHYNWMGVKSGSKVILSHQEFDRFSEAQGYSFTDAKYRKINNAANKQKIVDNGMILCYNEAEAIEKIIRGITEKREKVELVTEQKDLFS